MIKDNIGKARERIVFACARAKRDPKEVCLVAVSKNRTTAQIEETVTAGITDIGESRVQEGLSKYNAIRNTQYAPRIKWHMIGHLQTNKVREAVKIFSLIHSVDSLHLAGAINKEAARINKIQDILLEEKTSPEATKSGILPEEAVNIIKEIITMKNILLKGLMTIAPVMDNPEKTRPYFRRVKELKDEINSLKLETCSLQLLSMGMSDDFEFAVEEGSNMVRLGKAIFEG